MNPVYDALIVEAPVCRSTNAADQCGKMRALLCPHMSKPVCHPRQVKSEMEMGKSFITRLAESSRLSCHTQSPQLDRKLLVTVAVTMYREVIMIKGLFLTWLLLASASSDPGAEPFNPNFNRFRQKIPRIGRRGDGIIAEYMNSDSFPHEGSLSNFFLKASKAVPRLGRRKDVSTESGSATIIDEQYPFRDRLGLDHAFNEVPTVHYKQALWPNFDTDEFTSGPSKELNYPGTRITNDLHDNYMQDLIRSWTNQNENIN